MKKLLKILMKIFIILLICIALLLIKLTAGEYRPKDTVALEINGRSEGVVAPGDEMRLMTFNIGYGGLGRESDFFADGGTNVQPKDLELVQKNLTGISEIVDTIDADVYFFQEADLDSKRSYNLDETAWLMRPGFSWSHALNFSCDYVPYPLPPIGKVNSGIMTSTRYTPESSERIKLPSPFKWPVSTANLKRCLLVTRVPCGERELVLINLHLEAYDDGSGKAQQFEILTSICKAEYEKGNYVVAGGDFNCSFPGADEGLYPLIKTDNFTPGKIDISTLGSDWQAVFDESTPTCRLLDKPYDEASDDNQYYVIDGFILSPNVELLSVETLNAHFEFSDHNPVLLDLRLK